VAVKEHCDEYEMKDMDMNPVISCRLAHLQPHFAPCTSSRRQKALGTQVQGTAGGAG
jgi:hypothetical protein